MAPITATSAQIPDIPFSNPYGVKIFPRHVGLIPDGNRRWAKKNNYPVLQVHDMAVDRLIPRIEEIMKSTNVETVTLWGLSSENLSRPPGEVNAIYDVILKFIPKFLPVCHEYQIRMHRIGSKIGIPSEILEALEEACEETSCYSLRQVNIGINYGGRRDIVDAVNKFITTNQPGTTISTKDIDALISMGQDKFSEPELIIRSGADASCVRSSGFLTWQGMNSYYYFLKELLPDLTQDAVSKAFIEYENMIWSQKN